MALELSKNEAVLGDILTWSEAEMEKSAVASAHVTVTVKSLLHQFYQVI